ncbi:hypothetical protein FHR83_004148 [Actinoplanes campanulatus]|uniref:Protein dehydratase n=1 Tax=Actinoplanes campanulatus TaxID=113559 RepID=A0A7W5AHN6_9ACTN|nr:hypothetical protein [Actinoplanes campanulatus]GGN18008.1 hypothetical protein GCM10010109_30910 [Actinoplanes campanulatus]GID38545.1 hypothetical protein Aca09nite_50510 [Actinoplanes campanulatus]
MIEEVVARLTAAGETPARAGRDPVNLPMIRTWLEAMGDGNPAYEQAGIAPPAMIQVWTMRGLAPSPVEDPLQVMSDLLDEDGFSAIVATDSEQVYHRPLRLGETVSVRSQLEAVVGPKRTSLGEGWFVTTLSTWLVGDEPVGEMRFRIFRYKPGPRPDRSTALRPMITADNAAFWEGAAAGELRIQQCGECGTMRHPPGPACPHCGSLKPEYTTVEGTGRIHSYVVHHHPPVPGRRAPYTVALVDLTEGVRVVAEYRGPRPEIGDPVRVLFDDGLPVWRPDVEVLGPWELAVTPTLIVSTALATRDFQNVHHDRDAAVRLGGKDIFLNILTTTGLVQRFVTDALGPATDVRGIRIRLGTPCHAYDTLTFTGQVLPHGIEVVGRTAAGVHVSGTVEVAS